MSGVAFRDLCPEKELGGGQNRSQAKGQPGVEAFRLLGRRASYLYVSLQTVVRQRTPIEKGPYGLKELSGAFGIGLGIGFGGAGNEHRAMGFIGNLPRNVAGHCIILLKPGSGDGRFARTERKEAVAAEVRVKSAPNRDQRTKNFPNSIL